MPDSPLQLTEADLLSGARAMPALAGVKELKLDHASAALTGGGAPADFHRVEAEDAGEILIAEDGAHALAKALHHRRQEAEAIHALGDDAHVVDRC